MKAAHDSDSSSLRLRNARRLIHLLFLPRQNKLEEALLFSGQFTDALQALIDWLYRVEPQLAEDQPVHGDIDLVMNLIDNHKVSYSGTAFCSAVWLCILSTEKAASSHGSLETCKGRSCCITVFLPIGDWADSRSCLLRQCGGNHSISRMFSF